MIKCLLSDCNLNHLCFKLIRNVFAKYSNFHAIVKKNNKNNKKKFKKKKEKRKK